MYIGKNLIMATLKPLPRLSRSSYKTNDGIVKGTSPDGTEKFTLFYGGKTLLGNFYPASFSVDGIQFNNSECFFHYKKAGTSEV